MNSFFARRRRAAPVDPVESEEFSEYSVSFEDEAPLAEDPFAQLTPPASPRAPPQDDDLLTPTPPRFRHRRCPDAPLKRKRRDSLDGYPEPAPEVVLATRAVYDLEGNLTGDVAIAGVEDPDENFHFRWVRSFPGSKGLRLEKRPGFEPEILDLN